jgi:hypothetical protein
MSISKHTNKVLCRELNWNLNEELDKDLAQTEDYLDCELWNLLYDSLFNKFNNELNIELDREFKDEIEKQ